MHLMITQCYSTSSIIQVSYFQQSTHIQSTKCTIVTILYSGKLSREKTFTNWWKIQFFAGKSFLMDCSLLPDQRMPLSKFCGKFFRILPQNCEIHESFPLYGMLTQVESRKHSEDSYRVVLWNTLLAGLYMYLFFTRQNVFTWRCTHHLCHIRSAKLKSYARYDFKN